MPRIPPPRPPLVPGGFVVVQVALYARLHLQTVVNTLYYRVAATTPDITTTGEVVDGCIAAVLPAYINAVSNDVTFFQAIGRIMGRPDIPSITRPIITANVGLIASPSLPSTDAAVITLLSGFGGKRGRGRKYIFGCSQSGEISSQWKTSQTTLLNGLRDAMIADVATGDWGTGKAFLYSRNKATETGVAGVQVTSGVVQPTVGTQRRRRLGVGI